MSILFFWLLNGTAFAAADFSFRPHAGTIAATFEGPVHSPAHELYELFRRGRDGLAPDVVVSAIEHARPARFRAVVTLHQGRCDWILTNARPTTANEAYVTQLFLKDALARTLYEGLRVAIDDESGVLTTPSLDALKAHGLYTAEVRSHARGAGAPLDHIDRLEIILEPDREKIFVLLAGFAGSATHDLYAAAIRPLAGVPLVVEAAPDLELSTVDFDGVTEYNARIGFPMSEPGWELTSATTTADPLTRLTLPPSASEAVFRVMAWSGVASHVELGRVTFSTPNLTVVHVDDAPVPIYRARIYSQPRR